VNSSLNNSASTFLIDTGSDISIFKATNPNNLIIDPNITFKLSGIGEGIIPTSGNVTANLFFKNIDLTHDFQIVDSDFPIPCDGILGLDFIKQNNCNLDYYDDGPSWCTIRPKHSKINITLEIFDSPKNNILSLPARAEVIRKVLVNSDENELLIPTQELVKGVYVGNTLVNKNNAYVRIINTTDKNIFLENYTIQSESLKDYNVIEFNKQNNTKDRNKEILSKISRNCPAHQKEKLLQLCSNFTDIFALESDQITVNNFYKQKLRLKDNTPVFIKNYRLPHVHKPEIEKQITNMLQNDIIEPSTSEYNSPILLVPKKSIPNFTDKKWRLVVDYRQLNKKLLSDKYPLPRIDDILDQLGRAKYFSCLDLVSGFHQIELEEDSRDVTSFSTSQGSFRFKRLPFGLKISPNSFMRMISLAFASLDPSKAFIYMDDIIVVGCSEAHMLKNLEEIFQICRKTNLKLHPDKCNFFNSEVTFLGHKCTDKGILPDDSKFEKIQKYPRPTNADETRRFVAFVNYYRRFIPNFSHYAIHLTRLTRKNNPFIWSKNCENAFQYLKQCLLTPKILKYPNFDKEFCITCDASKLACGAVLSQNYNGTHFPIAFASRSFTKGESNKSVIEQELTAIHWAIKFFKPYIYGKKFLVRSDHKPLTYLFSLKDPSSKLTRMRLDLEEYDFEIEHIKGRDNCGADALSRINFEDIKQIQNEHKILQIITRSKAKTPNVTTEIEPTPKIPPKIYESISLNECKKLPVLKFDESARKINLYKGKSKLLEVNMRDLIANKKIALEQFFLRLNEVGNKFPKIRISLNNELFNYTAVNDFKRIGLNILTKVTLVLTPAITNVSSIQEQRNILRKFHDDPIMGGHSGVNRLLAKIRRHYVWKNMSKDVRAYVKNCQKCIKNKASQKHKEPMVITETPSHAFDIVQVDTIGPLPKTPNGNEYAITIVCNLTKYLISAAIPNKSALTVAKALVENCILIYGPIKQIITDMGSEYRNQIVSELCKLLKIEQKHSTAYHHQTLGVVERNHRTFNEYVRSYLSADKSDWDNWLQYFTYCYNTTPSTVHGYAPFELVFGKRPNPLNFLLTNKVDPLYNIDAYDKEVKYRLQIAQQRAKTLVKRSKEISKKLYDKNATFQNIQLNDMVYLENDAGHKLENVFKGPYQVIGIDEMGNCTLKIGKKPITVHRNRIKTQNLPVKI